jgi:hypothetical protein
MDGEISHNGKLENDQIEPEVGDDEARNDKKQE